MKRQICFGIMLLFVIGAFLVPAKAELTGSFYGTTWAQRGWGLEPLPFVLVQAGGNSTISGFTGHYSIENLPVGHTYVITAKKFGYGQASYVVELTPGNPNIQIDFVLTWTGGADVVQSGSLMFVSVVQGDISS